MKVNLKIANEPHRFGSSLYFFIEDGENIIMAEPIELTFNKDNKFHYSECKPNRATIEFQDKVEVISDFESNEFRSLRSRNEQLEREVSKLKLCIKNLVE